MKYLYSNENLECYCENPYDALMSDIEKKVLPLIYSDAFSLLTKEQLENNKIAQEPGLYLINELCKICRILSDEQMKSITADSIKIRWPFKTLLEWYAIHKINDKEHRIYIL